MFVTVAIVDYLQNIVSSELGKNQMRLDFLRTVNRSAGTQETHFCSENKEETKGKPKGEYQETYCKNKLLNFALKLYFC